MKIENIKNIKNIKSIKNNKIDMDYNKSILIKTKKSNKTIAVLFCLKAITKRKIHQGCNIWDVFYLVSAAAANNKLPKYNMVELKENFPGLKLGKYDGYITYLNFENYKIETTSLEEGLKLINVNEFQTIIKENEKKWEKGGGYIEFDNINK